MQKCLIGGNLNLRLPPCSGNRSKISVINRSRSLFFGKKLAGALLVGVLVLSTLGCATFGYPPLPDYQLHSEARIGFYIDEIGGTPIHTHVGTTVFNNFSASYEDHSWELREHAAELLEAELAHRGFVGIDLRAEGLDGERLSNLTTASADGWQFSPGYEALVEQLRTDYSLQAVIVLRRIGRHPVTYVCGSGGCQTTFADGMGVQSRAFLGLLSFSAVPAIAMSVHVLDPPVDLTRYKPLSDLLTVNRNTVSLSGRVERPEEIRELDGAFWATVEEALRERIQELVETAVSMLAETGS